MKSTLFWVTDSSEGLEGHTVSIFMDGDWGDMSLRNVRVSPNYTALQPRIPYSSTSTTFLNLMANDAKCGVLFLRNMWGGRNCISHMHHSELRKKN
jgi:hypothetical protein